MKVKTLRKALKGLPGNMKIVLQSDPEGNSYRKLRGWDPLNVYHEHLDDYFSLDDEDNGLDREEWESLKNTKRVLILYP